MACRGQLAGFFIDGEDGQAVVPTVGAVQEFSTGMNLNFGCAVTFCLFRQRGDRLDFGERSLRGIPGVGSDRGSDFIAVVRESPAGMKRKVPRPAAGGRLGK